MQFFAKCNEKISSLIPISIKLAFCVKNWSHHWTNAEFLFDEFDYLCGWKNEQTGEQKISRESDKYIQKAFSGIHIISPEIFPLMKMSGKFSMVNVYLELAKTHIIAAFDHSNSKFIDVGKPESIMKAEKIFK